MTPEQKAWTDNQWADYLKCLPTDIPKLKEWLRENYFIGIVQDTQTKLKYIELSRRHDTPSGSVRYIHIASSQPHDATLDEMVGYANNKFIPSLYLSTLSTTYNRVPQNVLHMLHVEKQK